MLTFQANYNPGVPSSAKPLAEMPWWLLLRDLVVLIAIRFALSAAVLTGFGGDPNGDIQIFDYLAAHPLVHFWGEGEHNAYPHLLGVLFAPFHGLSNEYWLRGLLIASECLIYTGLRIRFGHTPRWRAISWSFILGVWTAPFTSVWVQDEVVVVLPLVGLWLFRPSYRLSFLWAIVGIFAAKIFYLFVLLAGLATRPWGRATLVAVGGLILHLSLDRTGDFVPNNQFGVTLWVFSDLEFALQKTISTACTLGLWLLLECQIARLRLQIGLFSRYRLFVAIFLLSFYHINTEYFVFLTIPLIVDFLRQEVGIRSLLSAISWYASALGVNVAFALQIRSEVPESWGLVHAMANVLCFLLGSWHIREVWQELRDQKNDCLPRKTAVL